MISSSFVATWVQWLMPLPTKSSLHDSFCIFFYTAKDILEKQTNKLAL